MAAFSTLAIIGALAATGVSTYGQIRQGQAAKRAGEAAQESAESQAELADYNAAVASLQAQDALDRGAQAEHRFRQGVEGLIGAQRAGFAGANIDVGFGTPVDVQADAAYLGELDALEIRTNAAREAWGFGEQAADLRRRAEITRKEGVYAAAAGREQQKASYIGAAGTIIGGTTSLLEARYGFGRGSRSF